MRIAALLFVLLVPALALATPASDKCVEQYNAGAYGDAARCFEALEAEGHHNGHLLYDQGNAWYRAGDVGRAIHAWRRAGLFLPRDGDLAANLKSAREQARDDLAPPDARGPLARTLLMPYDRLAAHELLWLGAIAWALLLLLGTVRLLRAFPGATGLLVLCGVLSAGGLTGWAARSIQIATAPLGVVLSEQVTLRSGRDVQSRDLLVLHAGAELRVVEQTPDWLQIALSSGERGWLPADAVGLVVPALEQPEAANGT